MKDFNMKKYLNEHQMGSYGILNHYLDLKPLKEEEVSEDATPEEVAEIPYQGPDKKLTGLGDKDTFKEALDWEELDHTDVNGSSMEMLIDDAIYQAEKAIESTTELYPDYRHGLLRMKIKKLWLEKIKDWKGLPQGY